MNAWQKRITSASLLPRIEKSEPPFPPPIGKVVSAFLKVCSKPKNFRIERLTDGWNLKPPLYGPIALLNCTRYPRFTCTSPLSSTHGTRNVMIRSGSTMRSIIFAFSNSGCWLYTSLMEIRTSFTACKYSNSPGCFCSSCCIIFSTSIVMSFLKVILYMCYCQSDYYHMANVGIISISSKENRNYFPL